MRAVVALLVAVLIGGAVTRAHAEEARDPPVAAAVGAGAGVAVGSLAVGGGLAAAWLDDESKRRYGFEVMVVGVAVAPLVTHLWLRDWRRAGAYGTISVALGAVCIGLLEGTDAQSNYGQDVPRAALAVAFALELIDTAVALMDGMQAGARARRRAHTLTLAPTLAPGARGGGLALGGTF